MIIITASADQSDVVLSNLNEHFDRHGLAVEPVHSSYFSTTATNARRANAHDMNTWSLQGLTEDRALDPQDVVSGFPSMYLFHI